VFFAIGDTLTDGTDHIAGLTDPDAHLAPFIANDNMGPKAHLLAALNGFGDTSNLNDPLLPFGITLLATATVAAAALATTITAAAAFAVTAALASSFLAIGARHIRGGRNVAGLKLLVGFGHGERRNQN
jgi:hypothetical protein